MEKPKFPDFLTGQGSNPEKFGLLSMVVGLGSLALAVALEKAQSIYSAVLSDHHHIK